VSITGAWSPYANSPDSPVACHGAPVGDAQDTSRLVLDVRGREAGWPGDNAIRIGCAREPRRRACLADFVEPDTGGRDIGAGRRFPYWRKRLR
jgi:hypothetical protein